MYTYSSIFGGKSVTLPYIIPATKLATVAIVRGFFSGNILAPVVGMHNKICPSLAEGDTTKYLRRFTCLKVPFLTEFIFSRLKDASIGFGIRQTSARNADRIVPFPKNFRLFQTFKRNNGSWHFSKKASFLPASAFKAEKHRQAAVATIVWRYVTKRIEQISIIQR